MACDRQHLKVLTLGPDLNDTGGISSVLKSYARTMEDFSFLPTNSKHGTLLGLLVVCCTCVRLPFYRLSGYNAVHVHGAAGKSFIRKRALLAWARFWGFKTIFHCHAGSFREYVASQPAGSVQNTLKKCDAIICLGRVWKEYFEKALGLKRVFILNNIVELPEYIPERQVNSNICLRLLFLGKICEAKGVYDVLEALSLHKAEFEGKVEVDFAGPGEFIELRAKIAELGLGKLAKYMGVLKGQNKTDALQTHDIILLPSYIEGLPIVILEGAAYGLPSIATNVGSVSEVVVDKHNGIIISPGKPEEIANAIKYYLKRPECLASYGNNAKNSVSNFTPEAVRNQLEDIYRQL